MNLQDQKYSDIIEEIAKNEGISTAEVHSEIKKAIEAGINSKLSPAKAFWGEYPTGYSPTPEEVIQRVSMMIKSELNRQ